MRPILRTLRRLVWIISAFCTVSYAHAQTPDTISSGKPKIARMPSFQGGDINTFTRWVAKRLRYPKPLIGSNIEGRLVMKFIIERDGSITYWETVETTLKYGPSGPHTAPLIEQEKTQSPDNLFTKEVLRVIKQAPLWTPGEQENGEPVPVYIQLPVRFYLN